MEQKIDEVLLTLTNDSSFYREFTRVLRVAYEKKYGFDPMMDSGFRSPESFRKEMVEVIKSYGGESFSFGHKSTNNKLIYNLISHYSEEVFGFHVPVQDVLKFMQDGWVLSKDKDVRYAVRVKSTNNSSVIGGKVYLLTHKYIDVWEFIDENGCNYTISEKYFQNGTWTEVSEQDYLAQESGNTKNFEPDDEKLHGDPRYPEYVVRTAETNPSFTKGRKYKVILDNGVLSSVLIVNDQGSQSHIAWDMPKYWIPAGKDFNQETIQQTKQENNMNPSDVIKTHIHVFGENAANMTDDQLFSQVQKVESEIERLESVKTKPKKLEVRIAEMKKQLDALIEYIDSRD